MSKPEFELERSPVLGEHNEYIFKDLLGLSGGEFSGLVDEGVIE